MTAFTKGFAAGGILAAVVVVVAVKFVAPGYPQDKDSTTIVLQEGGRPCHPLDPVQLRRKTKKNVKWHIRNACSTAQWIMIDRFREKDFDGQGSEGQVEQIFSTPAPFIKGPIPPNQTAYDPAYDIEVTVNKDPGGHFNKELFYEYLISIGRFNGNWEATLDPDIDIWP